MKIPAKNINDFILKPVVACVLIYGPDHGLVRERGKELRSTILGKNNEDPFCYAELLTPNIISDKSVLIDEAAALSFTGCRRLIRIADASDGLAPAFDFLMKKRSQEKHEEDSFIIAESGDLGPRSPIRLLFEKSELGAAVPCYAEDSLKVGAFSKRILNELGHEVDNESLNLIGQSIGGDRAILRNELEKLSLYAGVKKKINISITQASLGDSFKAELEDAALASIIGNKEALDRTLRRCFQTGQSPVAFLRSLGRTITRLHLVSGLIESGKSPEIAMKALKPPVFWKNVPTFKAALKKWNTRKLAKALNLVSTAELTCKKTGVPEETVASRTALSIASAANKK